MEEEVCLPTALRESLLQMLSESAFIVRYDRERLRPSVAPKGGGAYSPPFPSPNGLFKNDARDLARAPRHGDRPARTAVSGALLAPCASCE